MRSVWTFELLTTTYVSSDGEAKYAGSTSGNPSSQDLYNNVNNCVCVTCAAQCGNNVCMGNNPNGPCQQCLQQNQCQMHIQACAQDI